MQTPEKPNTVAPQSFHLRAVLSLQYLGCLLSCVICVNRIKLLNTRTFHTFLPNILFVCHYQQFIHDILPSSTLYKRHSSAIKAGLKLSSIFTASNYSTHITMEARLLCLKAQDGNWTVTNGQGVLISQAHVKQARSLLSGANHEERHLMNCLTDILEKFPFNLEKFSWSEW